MSATDTLPVPATTRISTLLLLLAHLARIALGFVLLIAAMIKAADMALFAEQIVSYQILPGLAPVMARGFVIVEFALALALFANWRPRVTLPATGGLMLLFIGVISWAWAHGYSGPCGCFGTRGSKEPAGALLEDLLFLVLAILGWWGLRRLRGDRAWQRAALMLGVLLGVGLPLVAMNLPIDAQVTDARPGAAFDHIIIEQFAGDITQGEYLVALLDPAAEASIAAVELLNELGGSGDLPEVVGVLQGSNEELVAFMFEHDPYFELGHAPRAGLRRFYRRLPVFMLVRDGEIRAAWFDRAPDVEELRVISSSGTTESR